MATAVNLRCTVVTNGGRLYIRSGPSMSYSIIGAFRNGTSGLRATREQNGWYYMVDQGGWSSGDWLRIDENLGVQQSVSRPAQEQVQKRYTEAELLAMYRETQDSSFDAENISRLITKSIDGIYGVPYQFMPSVDPKMDGTMFGQIYAEKIIARMPLLLLAPGKVNFTRAYKDKDSAAQSILAQIDNAVGVDELAQATNNAGRYYTFDYDYAEYYKYVNAMCMSGAYFLGIENAKIKVGDTYKNIKSVDWGSFGTDTFKKILSNREYVAFYVDSASQTNETLSNTTTESQLASKVNSFADTGREISFLLGATTGTEFANSYGSQELIDQAMATIQNISSQYLNGNKLFEDIGKNFATIACGGKLIFPEIWSDSDFSNSYDINIKLRTPDGDKLSWFLNIYVPLAHLICLTAPREASDSGPNGYVTPFLVRGFYKGLFNCDMGIITSLSITRGREKAWTLDGLPTEVDVSLELKDLYKMLSITSYTSAGSFVNNIGLMDYIANMCGININEPDFTRSVEIYCMLKGYKLTHITTDIWHTIENDITNRIQSTQNRITNLLGTIDNILPV